MDSDNRQVVLLKSIYTLNRFYTLASPESGWKNAEEIEDFPDDVVLGIAYPCLEDGLNDFAVIRSTFDTVDSFPDDQELRDELMIMVIDARDTLLRRLSELRDRLASRQAHFLGTDLNEFKQYAINLAVRGNIRRTLDNMMKLDVYESVAGVEAELSGRSPESMYYFEFRPENSLEKTGSLPPLDFVVRMFDDVLTSARDDASYESKYTFDKHVFQKFIGLMFVNYATTDPIFYGTNKADYEVSSGRDMSNTPLYRAVSEALREIERMMAEHPDAPEEEVTFATIHERPHLLEQEDIGNGIDSMAKSDDSLWGDPALPGATAGLGLVYGDPERVFPTSPDLSEPSPPVPVGAQPFSSPTGSPQPVSASAQPYPSTGFPPPAGPPPAAPASAAPMPGPGERMVVLPNAATASQRILVPLNSITMAAQLLKNSADPMAATYAQMILAGVEALEATMKEWTILEGG